MSEINKKLCIKCGKSFESKRKDAKLCSNACAKALSRKGTVINNDVIDNKQEEFDWQEHIMDLPTFEEKKAFIKSKTIEELKKHRIWIPNWRMQI